jgi:valyl-tRNA synthetase
MSENKLITKSLEVIPKHFDFKTKEKYWSTLWHEKGIYKYNKNQKNKDIFVIDTPPPTVSGSLHIGHVFSYSQTDFIARFQRMSGKHIFYPMGWDDNGLPTERRVQNLYHIKCNAKLSYAKNIVFELADAKKKKKERPLEISRKNFLELCQKVTTEDEKIFKRLWTHLGLSVDWTLEYATIHDNSRKTAQFSFIDLYNKGHLYNAVKPIMWDVNFQTSIAQAEVEERQLHGNFYHIEFQVENGESFEIATTRPELLPACVGITAHPHDDRFKHLFGKRAITPLFGVAVPIFASEEVNPEKGTGIVMVCTFGDATDVDWWRKEQLPLRQAINKTGRMANIVFGEAGWESLDAELANSYYKQLVNKTLYSAKKSIIELLKQQTTSWQSTPALKKIGDPFERSVKYFEKGNKPLEFIASRQWFVKLLDKKEKILDMGAKVNWLPNYAKDRFDNWTTNLAFDWNISRQRYFGVPIPVWYPIDKNGTILYSKPILPAPYQLPIDPSIDCPPNYKASQRNQKGGFHGETDVFDTWFTSSLTPQINSKWIDDKEEHNKLFPANIRPQAHEIIRTWAFYTIVKALLHENTIPWKNAIISGWVLDPNKKKMSKSKGNIITPEKLIDKYSADGVRYWAAKARLGVDTTFDEGMMKIGQRLSTKIYNASKFVYSSSGTKGAITNVLDISFLFHLKALIGRVQNAFTKFNYTLALEETETFFWSYFTDSYIELVKTRAKNSDISALNTLRLAMNILLRLFAPFLPYVTEEVWGWGNNKETGFRSIHQSNFPIEAEINGSIKENSTGIYNAAAQGLRSIHKFKSDKKLSVGAFIEQATLYGNEASINLIENAIHDLRNAGRIKNLFLKIDKTKADLDFNLE